MKHLELALHIAGLDYEKDEYWKDESIIEDWLYQNFELSTESFDDLIDRLLPLIVVSTSNLTGTKYKGFADIKNSLYLSKIQVENDDNRRFQI
jgi:hypothetical protein